MHAWMNQADHYKSGSVRLIPHSFWESYLVQSVHTRRRFLTTNLFSWTFIINKIARKISKIRLRNLQPHWSVYHTNLRLSIATILSVTGDSCVNQKEEEEEEKEENSLPSTQSADSPGSLPQPFTFSNHGGSFHQTRDETRVVIASIFHLFPKKNSHNCLLPFLPFREQPRSLFANMKKRISVYVYKPNLTTKDPTDFFQSQQYNKSE